MKNIISLGLTTLMVAVFLVGISCAGDQRAPETEVLLKGALNQNNQFVDETGQEYDLVINEKTAALINMPEQMVEIKGTLVERDGKKSLTITEISPVKP